MLSRTAVRGATLATLLLLAGATYLATGAGPQAGYGESALRDSSSSTIAGIGADSSLPARTVSADSDRVPPAPEPAHRLDGVTRQFDAALTRRPENPAPLLQLAEEIATADERQGVEAHERLARMYPSNAPSWVGLARWQYEVGDRTAAQASVERALRIDPDSVEGRLLRGRLLAQGQPPKLGAALHEWRRVLELAPDSEAGREAAALLLAYEGR